MKKTIFYILSGFLLISSAANSQTDVQKAARIDSLFTVYTKKEMFNGSILISKKDKVLLSKGYGMANFSYDIPNTPSTKFKLASVSKQFTAMSIMILQEKGKLNTEDKLSKYMPDYPNADKITVHHLLTHTSGVHDVTSLPFFDSIMTIPHTLVQTIGYTKKLPLDFEPGSKFNYSNTGYLMLTYIIEKASGKEYGEFVQESIFKPLGMKNSGLYHSNEVLKNLALPYSSGENGVELAPYIDMSIPAGAGALYSTVEDLYLWDRALYTEKLVKKTTIDKIFTVNKDGYAYGWMIDEYAGHKRQFHSGGIQGFATIVNRFPDDELYIVILKNIDNINAFPAHKVARAIMYDQKYELPVEHKIANIDKKIYNKLCGNYELQPGFVITVSTEGGKLYTQATGQGKCEIYPESDYKYFVKIVNAQFEFNKNDKGEITALTLYQGGATMPAKKIDTDKSTGTK